MALARPTYFVDNRHLYLGENGALLEAEGDERTLVLTNKHNSSNAEESALSSAKKETRISRKKGSKDDRYSAFLVILSCTIRLFVGVVF